MDIAGRLDEALKAAGVPIVGVSIGRLADRGSWRIDYEESAGAAQRAQGEAIKLALDVSPAAVADDLVARTVDSHAWRALMWAVLKELNDGTNPTAAQMQRVRGYFVDRYKALT